jgi:hypothetical protein
MNAKPLLVFLGALAASASLPTLAQAPKPAPAVTGGSVVVSEPGKAVVADSVEATVTVTAIDKATRTVTLKGPQGNSVDVICGDEVKNFDQIRVGDRVNVVYMQALSLELRKTRSNEAPSATVGAVGAKPGDRPAGAVGREVRALADVVKVDQKNSIISLKGPRGNVIDLKVRNQDHFKVVKKGDQVEVVYAEAVALAVTPVKAAAKK